MSGDKITVIEDEPAIAETIRYALVSDGFSVSVAHTARDGLRLLEQDRPALIVLDIGLPDESGIELCKKIRKQWETPILFLSARSSETDRVVGLELGADDYVTKPFSPRELVARIKAILRRTVSAPREDQKSPKSGSPFAVDEQRHLITYFGTPLSLSRYEFKLLATLIGRPGWVFSREKLMALVWDESAPSMERTVDTHIKTIRSQLKAIHPEDPIVTHRSVGYALKEKW